MKRWLVAACIIAAQVAAGCATEAVPTVSAPLESAWGPLAVSLKSNGDKARNEGRLEITDTCVFLTRQGQRTLLIWPAAQTRWDAVRREILFINHRGEQFRLAAGQHFVVGGSGGGLGLALPPADALKRLDFVAPPMPECGAPEYWSIGDGSLN